MSDPPFDAQWRQTVKARCERIWRFERDENGLPSACVLEKDESFCWSVLEHGTEETLDSGFCRTLKEAKEEAEEALWDHVVFKLAEGVE